MKALDGDDFDAFFHAVHGVAPFPWQSRLARQIVREGRWPDQLDLPTATGKTGALDIALFHLAADAHKGADRRAPVRIAFVVDRRLIVDDAYARAEKIARALADPGASAAITRIRDALLPLAEEPLGDNPRHPLLVRRLRGGVPREDDWARTPSQPTILTSTVDQVGSRLLFRGYGLKHTMAPIHAGLLGADCLILLDEAHLSRPFEQTLRAIELLGRGLSSAPARPLRWAVMTATPAGKAEYPFALDENDLANRTLNVRLTKAKPTLLIAIKAGKGGDADDDEAESGLAADVARRRAVERERVDAVVEQVEAALAHLKPTLCGSPPVIGVVVNRVLRARAVYEKLIERFESDEDRGASRVTLVIGPARGVDRERLADKDLAPLKTGCDTARAALLGPRVVVATQTIEAGVDLDFDALITEVSALDALRQRFGRLNRAGRDILPYAAILAHPRDDLKPKGAGDPVYGFAAAKTWERLEEWDRDGGLDFAQETMKPRLAALSEEALEGLLTPKNNAPVVMPAYVDLWSHTSPIPAADPEVALFLHGPSRDAAKVRLVWRADLTRHNLAHADAVLEVAPTKAAEAVEVSLTAARAWMASLGAVGKNILQQPDFADAPEGALEDRASSAAGLPVFRVGQKPNHIDRPAMLGPGDVIVVPASYGGCDLYGWRPSSSEAVSDVGERAAWPYRSRRYAARLSPARLEAAMLSEKGGGLNDVERAMISVSAASKWGALAARLCDLADSPREQLEAVLSAGLPARLQAVFKPLRDARRKRLDVVTPYAGEDEDNPYRNGLVIVARFGLNAVATLEGDDDGEGGSSDQDADLTSSGTPTTEDDKIGSLDRRDLDLTTHSRDVECQAGSFARACGLSPAMTSDLALAGWLHDAGKADPRFQALLGTGDPLFLEAGAILGKSGRRSAPGDWARAELPENWRHEALSVRLALANTKLEEAYDPALVLWLVGTHHGWGRPLFPHADRRDAVGHPGLPELEGLSRPIPLGKGPQSLGFSLEGELFAPRAGPDGLSIDDERGLDWAQVFNALKRRYGVWGLAHLEAVVRLADHRASEKRDAEGAED